MASPIGTQRHVKLFVLFLLDNINYPLDYATINDIVRQTDFVMYLDFAEAFISMLDLGLIEKIEKNGEELYVVTKKADSALSNSTEKLLCLCLKTLFKRRFATLTLKNAAW